jgi:hypothetical protein
VDLLHKGLFPVATNQKPRPEDIQFQIWHSDIAQQATLAVLTSKNASAQEKWDIDNGKSYATIINSLTDALQKRYDEVDELGSDTAHWLLADLNARYGGAYDPKIIALFLIES